MSVLKRRTSGVANRSLRGRATAALTSFYLVHVTAVGIAREIIRAGQIEPRLCKALGANLVYFFAMRPAYKLRDADQKIDILDFFSIRISGQHRQSWRAPSRISIRYWRRP